MTLAPLDPAVHGAELYSAGHAEPGDPALWRFLPYGPFAADAFGAWLGTCASGDDPLFYAVVVDGEAQGMCAHMRIVPEHGVIEIGHVWFGPRLQRTAAATEAILLLAGHAFDDLGYRRLEWKCDAANERSRRAADRFGFTFEGVFRQHMLVKDRNRDTAWYSLLDGEWPEVRAGFEAWLDPANFDDRGLQRVALRAL